MLELPERHTTLTTEMRALTQRMDALTVEVRAFVEATNRRLDNIDSRLDRMEGDNASLKGFGAEYRAGVEIANIVEHLGKTWIRTLGRDTTRATRSAGLLSRFTGINASPIIAGVRVDNATQELIDDGQIHFYELEEMR